MEAASCVDLRGTIASFILHVYKMHESTHLRQEKREQLTSATGAELLILLGLTHFPTDPACALEDPFLPCV